MNEQETLIIEKSEEGQRLDQVLASRYQNIRSRTYFQKLIEQKKVLLNGEPVKKRVLVQPGDEVEIFFLLDQEVSLEPEPITLDILYEDEAILVVNKPANFVVHPAPGNWTGTFVNALIYHCPQKVGANSKRPGIVHRLDKDTTGVLIAAKEENVQTKLIEAFAKREVKKIYLALCLGNPGSGVIDQPIARHPKERKKMSVQEGGKEAITRFKTLQFDGKLSLVEVELLTGRTHQIRVHMHYRKTPILGDLLYGNAGQNAHYKASCQMLHAKMLGLHHPVTGKWMEFTAPLPEDFQHYLKRFSL